MIEIDFDKSNGLIPVIVQDDETKEVLMLAYMNREAWLKTQETGKATYWSRSRNELWVKGETSGHVQLVREILIDCDADTLVLKVQQVGGAACHTGYRSCFYRRVVNEKTEIVGELVFKPEDVYK
ncbi:MAG: phosphoribosyl-AMP cyclohydrolase [Deltaproteobacteria bacterium]|nr:phosphoribosyl-AMP cyclohydrolase [Deltaproteobacteria bacterium]